MRQFKFLYISIFFLSIVFQNIFPSVLIVMDCMDSYVLKYDQLKKDSSEDDQEGKEKNNGESEEESKGKENAEKEYKSIHEVSVYSLLAFLEEADFNYGFLSCNLLFSHIEIETQPPEIS